MTFKDIEIDDEKLMDEIDSLESDHESSDSSKSDFSSNHKETSKKFNYNLFFVVLLVLVILAYLVYERASSYGFEESVIDRLPMGTIEKLTGDEIEDYIVKKSEVFDIAALEREFKDQKDNLVTNTTIGQDKNLIVSIENKNKEPVNYLDCYVIFYDGEGYPIDVKEEFVDFIDSRKKEYIVFYDCLENYERVDVLIKKTNYYDDGFENLSKYIEFGYYEDEDMIYISGENNSSRMIDEAKFEILFFDENNQVMDISELYEFDIGKNKKFEISAYNNIKDNELNEKNRMVRYTIRLMYAITEK